MYKLKKENFNNKKKNEWIESKTLNEENQTYKID